jgi:hypothetical protein
MTSVSKSVQHVDSGNVYMHHYNSALKIQFHSSKRLNINSKFALVLEHQALKMDKGDGSKGPYLESHDVIHFVATHSMD